MSILLTGFYNKRAYSIKRVRPLFLFDEGEDLLDQPSKFCISTSFTLRSRSEANIKLFNNLLVEVKISSVVPYHSFLPS